MWRTTSRLSSTMIRSTTSCVDAGWMLALRRSRCRKVPRSLASTYFAARSAAAAVPDHTPANWKPCTWPWGFCDGVVRCACTACGLSAAGLPPYPPQPTAETDLCTKATDDRYRQREGRTRNIQERAQIYAKREAGQNDPVWPTPGRPVSGGQGRKRTFRHPR
jgi:hypothetical protein